MSPDELKRVLLADLDRAAALPFIRRDVKHRLEKLGEWIEKDSPTVTAFFQEYSELFK